MKNSKNCLRPTPSKKVQYLDWLANVVLVKKPNNQWCLCLEFINVHKACQKDCYPLLQIDLLVDAIVGHAFLSVMDAYSGYNQIRMYLRDKEKASFNTD